MKVFFLTFRVEVGFCLLLTLIGAGEGEVRGRAIG